MRVCPRRLHPNDLVLTTLHQGREAEDPRQQHLRRGRGGVERHQSKCHLQRPRRRRCVDQVSAANTARSVVDSPRRAQYCTNTIFAAKSWRKRWTLRPRRLRSTTHPTRTSGIKSGHRPCRKCFVINIPSLELHGSALQNRRMSVPDLQRVQKPICNEWKLANQLVMSWHSN